jgi:hypothetical protein
MQEHLMALAQKGMPQSKTSMLLYPREFSFFNYFSFLFSPALGAWR